MARKKYYRACLDMRDKDKVLKIRKDLKEKYKIPDNLNTEQNAFKLLLYKHGQYKLNLSRQKVLDILLS